MSTGEPSPTKKQKRTQHQCGPAFVRNTTIKLENLSVDDPNTGWREVSESRVATLTEQFKAGNFGLTVACGVTILEKESADGKKLIDDGLSTVMALLACQAYFAGEPQPEAECPKNIADIFTAGLQVKVIKYEDDDDREVRECWNIARHDEESFTVRWSSLHQKIAAVMAYFRRHGDWARTASAMTDFYGEGKKATVGRWVRAAKGLHPETAAALKNHPEMKGAYLWDNSYLVPSSTRARDRLAPKFALIALELLSQHSEELSASAFVEKVCKPLRLLEVWHSLMCRRYGSVATMSPALGRLVAHLASWSGLVTVRACMGTAVVLHDEQGIPECNLLAKELDKCKAGGLPPPATIPTEANIRASEEAARTAAAAAEAETRAAEEKKKEEQRKAEEEAKEAVLAAEADLLLLTSPAAQASGGAGVIAAPPPAKSRQQIAEEAVEGSLNRVHFMNVPDKLVEAMATQEVAPARFCCIVEAPTTSASGLMHLLDVVSKAWGGLRASSIRLAGTELTKFRLVVLVGARFDLIAKAMEKIKLTWPTWSSIVVQLQRRDRQSDRMRPCYAVVAAPAGELTATEPTVVTLPRVTRPDVNKFCLNKRCTEAQCQWRPEVQRDAACDAAARDGSCEIDAEDKYNLLDVMLGDLADETAAADSTEADGVDDEQASSQLVKRDAIVDLWPYGHTPAYYTEVLTLLGVAMKASGAIIVSTTAHPGHWMACLAMGLESWVLTRRWSEHSAAHGLALGRDLLLKDRLVDVPEPVPAEAEAPLCQCLQAALKQGAQEQVLEAYDLTQGTEWNEGINRVVPPQVLVPGSQALVRKEADKHLLRVSAVTGDQGRGVETLVARRDGEVVCEASALFFDDWGALVSLLSAPGNSRFFDRVCRIDGVKRHGETIPVWAVLLGIAQFVQHFTGYRSHPNAQLEYDPYMGFNNGALKVVAVTRTGVGIAPGSPVLLNYGAGFDFDAARAKLDGSGDAVYYGALDQLFAQQKMRVADAFAENVRLKEQEEAAQRMEEEAAQKAAAEAATKAEEEAKRQALQEAEAKNKALEEATRKAAEEVAKKRHAAEVAGADAKRPRLEGTVLNTLDECEVVLTRDGSGKPKLALQSTAETNKKVSAGTVLVSWTKDCNLSCAVSDGYPYSLHLKSDVVDKLTMKCTKLEKFVRETARPTSEIYGYEPFPVGGIPRVLAKKGNKNYVWVYTGEDKITVNEALEVARNSNLVSVVWIVKHIPTKEKLQPAGLALVLTRLQQIPGGGYVELP